MNKPTHQKDAKKTAINSNEQTSGSVYPLAGRAKQKIAKPHKSQEEIAAYKLDAIESFRFDQKAIAIGVILFVMFWISFKSGLITEHQVEFFIGCLLSFSLLIVAVCQAYIYKRQAYIMQAQELRMAEQQNVMQRQLSEMEQQRILVSQQITQTQEHFYISNRAYLDIENMGVIGNKLIAGQRIKIQLDVVNAGNTPAFDLHTPCLVVPEHIEAWVKTEPVMPEILSSTNHGQITNKTPHTIRLKDLDPFDEITLEQINSGELRWSILVEARYTCIQSRSEKGSFFCIFHPKTGTFSRKRQWIPFEYPAIAEYETEE